MFVPCKAGSSQSCTHIVAILLYSSRQDLNALEMVSSTDKKCLWRKHKRSVLEQFEAQPTKTFCCINQRKLPILSNHVQENIRNRLINCHSGTAAASHRNRRMNNVLTTKVPRIPFMDMTNINRIVPNLNEPNDSQCMEKDYTDCVIENPLKCSKEITFLKDINYDLSECCQNIYNNKIICNNVSLTARSTKDCKSKWQKERKFRVTGSRCYGLYTYAKENWPDKACKYFWAKEFRNKYIRHGNQYESIARIKHTKEYDLFFQRCGLIVSKTEPWMGYSPDGIVIKDNQVYRLLEIKCPYALENTKNEALVSKCKFLTLEKGILNLRTKHQYYGQIQYGMALLNLKGCDFVLYSNISNSIRVINISYDNQFVEKLLVNLKKKYFEKMLHVICENSII